ncbi:MULTISPECIES: hypothetical protein [Flavobacteriaceae]|uniref:hypothetical protein n=1 Tax=Flavobacteriaceae TaxID=49546 RepID=UPI001CD29893|nr:MULTISPECIES: hypothetical protein [Allomuricauda]MCA0959228.1 hypothetical protein [Allomuricauda ruestringensis]USD25436.1 hypothetical protein MJO53_00710 [Allomuricauda aquimarina]
MKKKDEIQLLRPSLNRLIEKKGCWNFDLEDCDNILRVESQRLKASVVSLLLQSNGFDCEELQ